MHASSLPVDELSAARLEQPPALPEGLVLAHAPTLWSGPAVEYSPSLRFLNTAPHLLLSPDHARELGVQNGDEVAVQATGERLTATVSVRTGVPEGRIFLSHPALPEGAAEVRARQAVSL